MRTINVSLLSPGVYFIGSVGFGARSVRVVVE